MLICIGGLPGVGKTTAARELARRLPAAHVRVDALETALVRQALVARAGEVADHGYRLALAASDTCLAAGTDVVADAVFPVDAARRPFVGLAERHGVRLQWFRLVCSRTDEHRRRVEERVADLPGHVLPTWAEVADREVDAWAEPHEVLDTAAGDVVATMLERIGRA